MTTPGISPFVKYSVSLKKNIHTEMGNTRLTVFFCTLQHSPNCVSLVSSCSTLHPATTLEEECRIYATVLGRACDQQLVVS
jgi:hypothetical protein